MADAATPGKGRLYTGYVIGLLLAVNILNFVDRQLPFILAESIKRDLGLSDTQIGLLGGFAFSIVYAVLGLPLAAAADRIGRKWVLAGALAVWSSLTALGGLAQTFGQLVTTRLGVAAGEAGSTPTAHALIAAAYPKEKRGLPMAIFSLGVPVGTMLGLVLGGWLTQVASWRQALVLLGLPGVALAVLVVLTVKEPATPGERRAQPSLTSTVRLLLSKPSFRQLAAAMSIYSMSANAMIVFLAPFLMRSHGLGARSAGLWLGLLYGVAGVAGTLAGGAAGDLLGRREPRWRLWAPALGLVLAAPFTLGALFAQSTGLSVLLLAAPKFANLLYMSPVIVALHTLVPAQSRASASAFLLMFNSLLGSLGPLLTGMLSDRLTPMFGQQALRYALVGVAVAQVWSALHFVLAARTLARDRHPDADLA
jgi:predicted MFS family arabinose efflux permease